MKITPEQLKRLANEQHAVISRLRQALDAEVESSSTLREENAKLRAALKPFAEASQIRERASFSASYLRAAAAALKETGDE